MTTACEATADTAILIDIVRGVLGRHDGARWLVRPDRIWCTVTASDSPVRKHGWKLHVSATPLAAPLVLARSAEILLRHGCSFKFAADIGTVRDLVGPYQDRAAAGKFITAYPRDDDQLRTLAEEVDRATADLAGPRILSDRPVRPGSLVHYRYGGFAPDLVFTDEGVYDPRMVGPDGAEVRDERLPWFAPPAWALPPFPPPQPPADKAMVLAGRFRVTRALRHANKGGVFEAVDETGSRPVIVKQARAHIGATLSGSDGRDLLRHEARMLTELADLALFPDLVELFEEQGDLFLAQTLIPGVSADVWAYDIGGNQRQVDDVWPVARELVRAVGEVHKAGYVVGDLKPGNIMITPEGGVRLVDAELVGEVSHGRVRGYTVGYAPPELSPDLSLRQPSSPAADCFSLGVTLFSLASGGAPAHWVAGRPGHPRPRVHRQQLLAQIAATRLALDPLVEPILGLTEADPALRWSTAEAWSYLKGDPPRSVGASSRANRRGGTGDKASLDGLIADGVEHLRRAMTPDEAYLWRSHRTQLRHDPCDAWRGSAGVLATLTRAAQATGESSTRDTVAAVAAWIHERLFEVPRILPGLSFGRAGTAIALNDAALLLGDDRLASRALALALQLPIAGPNVDVASGLSGAGLARLRLWRTSGDPVLRVGAQATADAVIAAAQRDGDDWRWPIPLTIGTTTGTHSSYGFAHGIAGIGTFLLGAAVSAEVADRRMEAAIGAGETLLRAALVDRGRLAWPAASGDEYGVDGLHWCNGPSGIGMFLIRLAAATGNDRYAAAARRCALATRDRWTSEPGACCGLAGAGHFLLDLAEVTGERRWHDDAFRVGEVVDAQAVPDGELRITREPAHGYAYGDGTAGVLDFLIRLRHGGPSPWLA